MTLAILLKILPLFEMKIMHRRWRSHGNADGTSRIRCKQYEMYFDIQAEDSAEKIEMHDQVAQVTDDQVVDLKSVLR